MGAALLLAALALVPVFASAGGGPQRDASAPSEREILDRVAAAQVGFVENVGQAHPSATHVAQGPGYAFAFGRDGVRVSLVKQPRAGAAAASSSVGLEFVGANPAAEAVLAGGPSGGADYLVGERSRWRTGLATYPELVYRDLWPGVDMAFSGSRGRLKYEFRVAPGADPSRIRLAYQGAQTLSLSAAGALNVDTARGVLRDAAPVSYQRIDGRRVPVESNFNLGHGHAYGFALGAYDHTQPLVIDPALEYSTYLGGSDVDNGLRIALEGNDAYVTGNTFSLDFPVTPGAFDTTENGTQDVFVSRLDTDSTGAGSLKYSTFLGGSGDDAGLGIEVRGDDVFLTGIAISPDFPVTPNAYDPTFNGFPDAFVARLDTRRGAAGLEYSSYLGSAGLDVGLDLAVEGDDAFVTGTVGAPNFPVTADAFDPTFNGGVIDGFVTRIDTTKAGAAGLEYSSFLGGGGPDSGRKVVVRGRDAYIAGPTGSPNFPVSTNAFDTTFNGGGLDAFVTRLDMGRSGLAGLKYSTYLGGAGTEDEPPPARPGTSLEVVGHDAYVAGVTTSPDFPVTSSAYDTTLNGGQDVFVTRLDTERAGPAGIEYSTYLGGTGNDIGRSIAVTGHDGYVTGGTSSADFPVTADAFQAANAGGLDAFVFRLDTQRVGPAGLEYSTYLGGSGDELSRAIAVKGHDAFVTGLTSSADFPTQNAFDATFNGVQDAFVTRLDTKSNED